MLKRKFIQQFQKRHIRLGLHWLQDNRGARKKKVRKRGPAAKGDKVGKRGNRGGNHEFGPQIRGYTEYHITPFYRKAPKRGFSNKNFATPLSLVTLTSLKTWIEKKRLDPKKVITIKRMWDEKLAPRSMKFGIKLIRGEGLSGTFPYRIRIHVTRASPGARDAIEQAGGVVEYKFFNRESMKTYLKPHTREILPKYYDNLPETFRRHKFPDYPQLPINPMIKHVAERYATRFQPSRPTSASQIYEEKE